MINKKWNSELLITKITSKKKIDHQGYLIDYFGIFLREGHNFEYDINVYLNSTKMQLLCTAALGVPTYADISDLLGRVVIGMCFENVNEDGSLFYNVSYFIESDLAHMSDLFFMQPSASWNKEALADYKNRFEYVEHVKHRFNFDLPDEMIEASKDNEKYLDKL